MKGVPLVESTLRFLGAFAVKRALTHCHDDRLAVTFRVQTISVHATDNKAKILRTA